jgi:hypothetical protein
MTREAIEAIDLHTRRSGHDLVKLTRPRWHRDLELPGVWTNFCPEAIGPNATICTVNACNLHASNVPVFSRSTPISNFCP